jgi:hypothetical protein
MDSFYCLVRIILNKKLSLYCFNYTSSKYVGEKTKNVYCPICFSAKSSKNLIRLFSLHYCYHFISINHAFYLGQELYKAELSLILNQIYIQN